MEIKIIETASDHAAALEEIETLMSAELGTHEGDRLDLLSMLVVAYEKKNFPIEGANLEKAIRFQIQKKY